MNALSCGFAGLVEQFARHRQACGTWNNTYESNMTIFDHFCARCYPSCLGLTQQMVDTWCA